jgi:hypothetical protein
VYWRGVVLPIPLCLPLSERTPPWCGFSSNGTGDDPIFVWLQPLPHTNQANILPTPSCWNLQATHHSRSTCCETGVLFCLRGLPPTIPVDQAEISHTLMTAKKQPGTKRQISVDIRGGWSLRCTIGREKRRRVERSGAIRDIRGNVSEAGFPTSSRPLHMDSLYGPCLLVAPRRFMNQSREVRLSHSL